MPVMVSGNNSTDFKPAPAGTHQAVCVDVIDLGMVKTTFQGKEKMQHKVSVRWQIDELMENGKRFIVQKRYTASLHEKSHLRHDLESWRNRPFTEAEIQGFDLEHLIGANCLLGIIHDKRDGKTWANVTSVLPLGKSMQKIAPEGYERKAARPATQDDINEPPPPTDDDIAPADDDIPF